jgi:hypothetical protein
MQPWQRENLLPKILSGRTRFSFRGKSYVVKKPSQENVCRAVEVFERAYRRAEKQGLYSEGELSAFLYENGFWDDNKEKILQQFAPDIENLKLELWQNRFRSNAQEHIRGMIRKAEKEFALFRMEKSRFDHLSVLGCATSARVRALFAFSLFRGETPIFTDFWKGSSSFLDNALTAYMKFKPDDREIRELARTEPWRSVWVCKKVSEIFPCRAIDFTDEQRNLVGWSSHYDNIFEHPDCPGEEVVSDDDMLDGWCVEQKRKRNSPQVPKGVDGQEIFIPVDTPEDAKKIEAFNSPEARRIKQQRQQVIRQKGSVSHHELPDVARQNKMAANQQG